MPIINKTCILLAIICLVGCTYLPQMEIFKEISEMDIFQEPETIRVSFKPGAVHHLDLGQTQDATVVLLPVRSTMGGGLGEESVTKHFYENLVHRFNNLRFISNDEASDLFTDMDMWEDYFEYLVKYHQSSVVDFDELKGLYQQLGANYIISINSDYTLVPTYPTNFGAYIHIQIWDIDSAKIVWEGFGQGDGLLESPEDTDIVRERVVDRVCQRLAEEIGTIPVPKDQRKFTAEGAEVNNDK